MTVEEEVHRLGRKVLCISGLVKFPVKLSKLKADYEGSFYDQLLMFQAFMAACHKIFQMLSQTCSIFQEQNSVHEILR